MAMKYILSIDQSTSGTKAILFDEAAVPVSRFDLPHEQKITNNGFVSHDPMEIYRNTLVAVKAAVVDAKINRADIAGVAIANQRETALVWNRATGIPIEDAVVWQCSRGQDICTRLSAHGDLIKAKTGLPLSPYFSAAKIAWLLEHSGVSQHGLCAGTIDSWLIFKLTDGKVFATDCSNASRTQLFDIVNLQWDAEICDIFGIDTQILPEIRDSNAFFGETSFGGFLPQPVPIHAALGDSHASLFGHGCVKPGMAKATYGTGSSVMMNIGERPVTSKNGLASSLAWKLSGKASYVLEGNIHYSCAVIKWLVEDVKLISSAKEAGQIAKTANSADLTYLVPAFTGLGAPHWKPEAKALIYGMTRTTGRAEIVKAAEECIAYQIADVVNAMNEDSRIALSELRVDGGAAGDEFLTQFQSDILGISVAAAQNGELSAFGAAAACGIALGVYPPAIVENGGHTVRTPAMDEALRTKKLEGWHEAVGKSYG